MNAPVLSFPAGSAINFTTGEYSDFGNCGCIVTIKPCDLSALAKEFAQKPDDYGHTDLYAFASWLVANGHAMPADIQDVHLGEYGRFGSEFGVEAGQ